MVGPPAHRSAYGSRMRRLQETANERAEELRTLPIGQVIARRSFV
jgi:hypothetical protein